MMLSLGNVQKWELPNTVSYCFMEFFDESPFPLCLKNRKKQKMKRKK